MSRSSVGISQLRWVIYVVNSLCVAPDYVSNTLDVPVKKKSERRTELNHRRVGSSRTVRRTRLSKELISDSTALKYEYRSL